VVKIENVSKAQKNQDKENNKQANGVVQVQSSKDLTPEISSENSVKENQFRNHETKRIMRDYSSDLIENLLSNEHFYWTKNCLQNHNIPANIRAKMIDWMVEVLCSYKCTNETFFVAVYYLDAFFKNSTINYEIND